MSTTSAARIVPKEIALNRAYNGITRDDYTPEAIDRELGRLYASGYQAGRASRDSEVAELDQMKDDLLEWETVFAPAWVQAKERQIRDAKAGVLREAFEQSRRMGVLDLRNWLEAELAKVAPDTERPITWGCDSFDDYEKANS